MRFLKHTNWYKMYLFTNIFGVDSSIVWEKFNKPGNLFEVLKRKLISPFLLKQRKFFPIQTLCPLRNALAYCACRNCLWP